MRLKWAQTFSRFFSIGIRFHQTEIKQMSSHDFNSNSVSSNVMHYLLQSKVERLVNIVYCSWKSNSCFVYWCWVIDTRRCIISLFCQRKDNIYKMKLDISYQLNESKSNSILSSHGFLLAEETFSKIIDTEEKKIT